MWWRSRRWLKVVAVMAGLFDDGSELGVAVEGGAADAGLFGDGGEGDRFAVVGEAEAGAVLADVGVGAGSLGGGA